MKVKVDNKKALVLTFGVLLMIGTIFGLSYAYFDDEEDPRQSSTMELTSANLTAEFTDSSEISIDNMLLGQSVSKTFVVSNTGIVPLTYDLVFDSVESTFTLDDFVYTLTSTNGGGSVAETIMPTVNGTLVTNILAPAETTQTYILTISLKNDPLNDQSADRNATFDGRIKLISPYGSDGTFTFRDFQYTGNGEEFVVPETGLYKIETWGAQGTSPYAKGGYTSGEIYLLQGAKLYVYVGQCLSGATNATSFNGGTGNSGGNPGGGATDIRLVSGNWDNNLSLNSRIMVASGAGSGSGNSSITTGSGGGLNGYNGNTTCSYGDTYWGYGSTQIGFSSVSRYSDPKFGIGGGGCGGGGGYYGGTGAACVCGGGGGSSYISGHAGSIAIQEGSVTNPRAIKTGCTSTSTSRECSIHYSGYSFSNTVMIDGAGYSWTTEKAATAGTMPSPTAGTEVGHAGNGYARITYIGDYVKDSSLLVHYDGYMNTTNGHSSTTTSWHDLSGNGRNGTLNNFGSTSTSGWQSDSLAFDGTNDWVSIGQLNQNTYTIEVVLKQTVLKYVEFLNNWQGGGYGMTLVSGKPRTQIYTNGAYSLITSSNIYPVNLTFYMAGSYNGNELKLYENGVETNSLSVSGTIGIPTNNTIMILGNNPSGSVPESTYFQGNIHSVRIYSRALTQNEITQNYNLDNRRFNN